jgi:hypothetical protein
MQFLFRLCARWWRWHVVDHRCLAAFGDGERFSQQNVAMIEENVRVWFCHQMTHRWLNTRFDLVSILVQGSAAFSCVYHLRVMMIRSALWID